VKLIDIMMRKLSNKKEEQKRKQRNQIIIGVILVVVMFGSVFGLATMNFDNENNDNSVNYNGYEFYGQNNYWYLGIGERDFVFQYNPYQIQDSFNVTTENLRYLNDYSGQALYLNSYDSPTSEGEIVRVFNGIALRIQRACLAENGTIVDSDCPEDLPLKDCTNNFIIIKEDPEGNERIIQQDKCVFIYGSAENLIKLTDDYLYRIMGIKSQF
jgi:hypothetical protein